VIEAICCGAWVWNWPFSDPEAVGRPDSETLNVAPEQMPTMLPIEIINMDAGYSIMFSHKTKGTVRAHGRTPENAHVNEVRAIRAPPLDPPHCQSPLRTLAMSDTACIPVPV
jgi:hypothetical protein